MAVLTEKKGVEVGRRIWKDAFRDKAFYVNWNFGSGGPFGSTTLGYRVIWYLWSADIWFGRFPLLKFILGVNILMWIVLLMLTNFYP